MYMRSYPRTPAGTKTVIYKHFDTLIGRGERVRGIRGQRSEESVGAGVGNGSELIMSI